MNAKALAICSKEWELYDVHKWLDDMEFWEFQFWLEKQTKATEKNPQEGESVWPNAFISSLPPEQWNTLQQT